MTGGILLDLELRQAWRRLTRLGHGAIGGAVLAVAASLLLLGAAALVAWIGAQRDGLESVAGCCILGGGLLTLLVAPGVSATAISGDRQRGSWDLLVTSLLSQQELIWGKLGGRLLWALLPVGAGTWALACGLAGRLLHRGTWASPVVTSLAAATLPGLLWLAWRGRRRQRQAIAGFLVVALPLFTVAAGLVGADLDSHLSRAVAVAYLVGPLLVVHLTVVGLWCSVATRRTSTALALSYGYMVGSQLVLPILEAMIRQDEPLVSPFFSAPVALMLYSDSHDQLLAVVGQPLTALLLTAVLLASLLSPRRRRWVEGTLG